MLKSYKKHRTKNWNINILVSEWRWRKYHNCSQESVLVAFEKFELQIDSNFIETNNLLNSACGKSECRRLLLCCMSHSKCYSIYHEMQKCSWINKFWDGFCCQYDADFGKLCPVGALQPIRYMNDTSPVSKKNLIYLIKKILVLRRPRKSSGGHWNGKDKFWYYKRCVFCE